MKECEMDYTQVASFLLDHQLHLTALEMHAELVERNKRVSVLEQFTQQLEMSSQSGSTGRSEMNGEVAKAIGSTLGSRVGSQVTLDSQSLWETRYSDTDSGQKEQERVAVLEFELRRSNELIQSLRAELQQALDTSGRENLVDVTECDEEIDDSEEELELSNSEVRALNFVVHEYLLLRGNKMSAVTFCEENSDQDLDEWEAVQPRPPPLHKLYSSSRGGGDGYRRRLATSDSGQQTNMVDVAALELGLETLRELKMKLEKDVEELRAQLEVSREEMELKTREVEATKAEHESLLRDMEVSREEVKQVEERPEDDKHVDVSDIDKENNDEDEDQLCVSSSSFVSLIQQRCLPYPELMSPQEKHELSKADAKEDLSVLETLVNHVPRVVPNVIVAKRDELIPLLLVVINRHHRSEVRDAFLHILFNLIKRPDGHQRRIIIRGFAQMALALGAQSLECELLPQCWEQIGHKYEERRMLVAETIAVIAPSVPKTLRMSLLLSMVSQMAMEDRDMEVRIGAIKAMAILVLYSHEDKFESVFATTTVLLKDPCRKIVQQTQATLLLSLAEWSLRLGVLESRLLTDRVSDLSKQTELAEDEEDLIFYVMEDKLEGINLLIPFLFASIVKASPHNDNTDNTEEVIILDEEKASVTVETLLGSEAWMWPKFHSVLSNEWYASWPQLQWLRSYFLKELCSILARLTRSISLSVIMEDENFTESESDVKRRTVSLLQSMVNTLTTLTKHTGKTFGQDHLWPQLNNIIEQEQGRVNRNHGILLVALLGVAHFVFSPNVVCDLIEKWVIKAAVEHNSSMEDELDHNDFENEIMPAMVFVVDQLLKLNASIYKDAMAELGWRWLVHQEYPLRTRRASAALFVRVLRYVHNSSLDASLLETKLLPGLVTLSSDVDALIRLQALPGLVFLVANDTGAVQERALLQTLTFIEPQVDHASYLRSIELIKHYWTSFPSRVREEVLLKQVFHCYTQGEERSEEKKAEIATALIDLIRLIASHNLSVNCVHDCLMPHIDLLRSDVSLSLPVLDDQIRAIVNRLQAIYGPRRGNGNTNSLEGPRSMSQSNSMENVRQRMGKFLQRPAVSQVQFWKK